MKSYETDSFGARKARDTATVNKLLEKVLENLIKANKKGDKMSYQNLKKIFKEWYKIIIKFPLPSSSLKPLSIEYVDDLYRGISALRTALKKKENSLRHECVWKV